MCVVLVEIELKLQLNVNQFCHLHFRLILPIIHVPWCAIFIWVFGFEFGCLPSIIIKLEAQQNLWNSLEPYISGVIWKWDNYVLYCTPLESVLFLFYMRPYLTIASCRALPLWVARSRRKGMYQIWPQQDHQQWYWLNYRDLQTVTKQKIYNQKIVFLRTFLG